MSSIAVTGAEFSDLMRSPFVYEELNHSGGVDAVFITDNPTHVHLGPAGLPACPVIVVGDNASWADVVLHAGTGPGSRATLDELMTAIAANPIASSALSLLLRAEGGRSIADGLAAESAVYSTLQSGPEFARWRSTRTTPGRTQPAADAEPAVVATRDGNVVRITLNRPHKHNAFSVSLRDGLVEQLSAAMSDPSVSVIINGAGPSFCSGGDLDEFGSFLDPAQAHLVRLARSAGRLVAAMATRVEVHVHGACMGAGIELPAFAGRVTAHPDTVIALPEIALGLIPGAGGTVSIPRRIGRQRTAWLALSGARIDAATALGWGLIDEVTDHSG